MKRRADRRGLDERAAVPGLLQLGVAVEIGFGAHISLLRALVQA